MLSVYSPQLLRQKKIDSVIGINKWEINKRPTIKDLYEKHK